MPSRSKLTYLGLIVIVVSLLSGSRAQEAARPIPLLDFRQLVTGLSEPEGYFDTDNLISNESAYLSVLPALKQHVPVGGVYIGVGPDQNFSYIAAVQPVLAIIVDIRRQNALQHLYYKALFHLSANRTEYLERLFGRPLNKRGGHPLAAGISELLEEISSAARDNDFALRNANEACRLMRDWDLGLAAEDFRAIRYIANAFVTGGPDLQFTSFNRSPRPYYPTYRTLLTATDFNGVQSNFLATERSFGFIKRLEEDNCIIPIVGDLSGTHAMQQVAQELRRRHLKVSCLYVSNVEFYLFGGTNWSSYIRNLNSLPRTGESWIIRSYANSWQPHPAQRSAHYMTTILQSIGTMLSNEAAGKNATYWNLVTQDSIFP